MNKINLHNYEIYYLDYLEGNLSAEDTTQLFLFLDKNPGLKSAPEDFEMIQLKANETVTFNKESLYQNITENNVEDYIIASIENEIKNEDATELAEYLNKSPNAKALADRYGKTILSKPSISFPGKKRLKKKAPTVYYLTPMIAVAASFILILLVFNPFSSKKTDVSVAFQKTGSLKPDSTEIVLKNEVVTSAPENIDKRRNANLNHKSITAKQNRASEEEKEQLAEKQNTNSGIADSLRNSIPQINVPEKLPEIRFAASKNKTGTDTVTSPLMADMAEKKQIPEPEHLVGEKSIVESLENKKATATIKMKSRGFNLWRVAEIGVKVLGKLNEKDLALKRSVTASDQASSIILGKQRKNNGAEL